MTRLGVGWRLMLLGAVGLLLLVRLQDTHIELAPVEYNKAKQLFLRGQLEKCEWAAERGHLRHKTNDPEWAEKFYLLEAEVLLRRGMADGALRLIQASHTPPDSPEDAMRRLVIESVALTRLHQVTLADQRLTLAESLCKNKSSLTCGEVMQARGVIAGAEDRFPDARLAFLGALSIARSLHDQYLESTASLNLGWLELQVEHFDESVDWSTNGYRLSSVLEAEDLAETITGNLGWAYFKLGDAERALELFVEAEHRAAKLGNIRNEVKWLTTSGDVYWSIGDSTLASRSYSQALTLALRIDSKQDIVNSLEDLAHASIDAGKIDDATNYIQQLDPLVRAGGNRLDELDVALAQARIAASRHRGKDAEVLFREIEKDQGSQTSMRLEAEHELAKLYESESDKAAADRMYRTSLTTFESARDELKNEDSKLPFLANATGIYDDYIHFLVAQGKTEEALSRADHSRARTLQQGLGLAFNSHSLAFTGLHASDIARKTNATLLFYWLGEKQSYLWVITEKKTSMFPLVARSQITPMVERYRKVLLGLSDPAESSNADGLALYRTLVAPARELIKPGSTVVILGDGVLSQLNFETLIVPDSHPRYWIEDANLISAPSLAMLAAAKPVDRLGNKLLLFGHAVSPNSDYPDLPKAESEMKQIQLHFTSQDETVFARERATPSSYVASSPQQFAYIHFVAHGVASRTDPLDSAIILSRSSAAEDSFKLHARDIIQHPIHARLVTISACYGSGTRTYAGEGLVGLAWAFLRAGSHNVIGALWEVSDESTPRLMGSLYLGLQNGMAPGAALRQAKLNLLHSKGEFRKPFFWAPLQMYTGS